ncbi:hypothetical protein ABGB18_21260 [Nonomuraea sp. B12E4]|uniref:hypothetical protein n=1 Tax=Nonomuraea sp. B12E4 TaxID=3153564 RepID=UPI00325F6DDB
MPSNCLVEGAATRPPRRARDAAGVTRPAATAAHRRWREQAGSLLERVSAGSEVLLGVEVALAGWRPARAPLRQAMVQRTFETWTHTEDIRAATDRTRSARSPTTPAWDRYAAGW